MLRLWPSPICWYCFYVSYFGTYILIIEGIQCRRTQISLYTSLFFCLFFSVRLLSVLRGHSATTANDLRLRRIFYPRFYPLHLFSYLNFWEKASIFPFECSVLNKGTTGTIFITYDAVLDCGLNLGPPTLKASTLPLGYRGGSEYIYLYWKPNEIKLQLHQFFRHNLKC